jgi:putative aminopeptidase FrvX
MHGRRATIRSLRRGAIAQLGERLDRTQEVAGSSPASSISVLVVELTAFLKELCAVPAPSGAEDELAALLLGRWREPCAEIRCDAVGNIVARVGGAGPRVLVQAHMDQVGYLVRHVTDDGFLLLDTSQGDRRTGPERRHPVGQPVRALARDGSWVDGLLAAASGHVLTAEQREEHRLGYDDFWVELGLPSREAVRDAGIHVGSPVVFSAPVRQVGELLAGPSMDNRVGLAIMDALLDALDGDALGCELWLAATVQEENGLHGARALAHSERFDAVVAVDVGLVGDIPTVQEREHGTALGKGPIVVHRDTGIVYDRALTQHLLELAERADLAAQDGVFAGYGSDGLTFAESGSPTALITVPTRYTHTAFEAVHPRDLAATVDLLRLLATGDLPSRGGPEP